MSLQDNTTKELLTELYNRLVVLDNTKTDKELSKPIEEFYEQGFNRLTDKLVEILWRLN